MSESIDYDVVKDVLHGLNSDDTISSAHGILCGFTCSKPDVTIDNWLGEVLVNIDLNNLSEKEAFGRLTEIFNNTNEQLADPVLNFSLLIADDSHSLREQAHTLVEWCQGFLVGLGLSEVQASDEDVLEMIKDISDISQLEAELLENEENAKDLSEIVEFVRMAVLLIQETLQPSKHDYISTDVLN